MSSTLIPLALAAAMFPGLIFAPDVEHDKTTVSSFELSSYLGTWYEIARYDHRFERGMDNVTAEYLLRDDGKVDVINSGWRNGKMKTAHGKARQPDPSGEPARLRVSFFMFFYSDYRVLMIDEDYSVALVGRSSPGYLWILSRTPELDGAVLGKVLAEARRRGYDTSKLIYVDQSLNR